MGNLKSALEDIQEARARNKAGLPAATLLCYYANLLGKQEGRKGLASPSFQEAMGLLANAIPAAIQKDATKEGQRRAAECLYHR